MGLGEKRKTYFITITMIISVSHLVILYKTFWRHLKAYAALLESEMLKQNKYQCVCV